MKKFTLKLQAFSLVELMAVVTIMGILVALALPRFRTFVARSRMAEAISNLAIINSLQKSYNLRYMSLGDGKDDVWWGLGGGAAGTDIMGNGESTVKCDDPAHVKNQLGFRVEECERLRYTYKTHGADKDEAINENSVLLIYPDTDCQGAGSTDQWFIHRDGSGLEHKKDIIEFCK